MYSTWEGGMGFLNMLLNIHLPTPPPLFSSFFFFSFWLNVSCQTRLSLWASVKKVKQRGLQCGVNWWPIWSISIPFINSFWAGSTIISCYSLHGKRSLAERFLTMGLVVPNRVQTLICWTNYSPAQFMLKTKSLELEDLSSSSALPLSAARLARRCVVSLSMGWGQWV